MKTLDESNHFIVRHRDKDCLISFPKEDYLVLYVSVPVSLAGSKFEHPNILIKSAKINEYKHYRKDRKYWTAKAAIQMYFAFMKKDITLEQTKCNFSYVQIGIGGDKFLISCSGGTGPMFDKAEIGYENDSFEWYDKVSQGCYLAGDGYSQKRLKALAEHAISPEECRKLGIVGDCTKLMNEQYYMELVARSSIKLNKGMKVVLSSAYSMHNNHGPFEIVAKVKKHWLVQGGCMFHVYRKHIDWLETAKANNIQLPPPVYYNRLDDVDDLFYNSPE